MMRRALAELRGRCRVSESGQAAGIESIPFGILVFVGGLIMVVNVWAVVDSRAALDTAARDYLRAYTAAPSSAAGRVAGDEAARRSMASRATAERRVVVTAPTGPFGPCRPATVRLELALPAITAPFIGSIGTTTISVTQTELVQPYGRAIADPAVSGRTICDE